MPRFNSTRRSCVSAGCHGRTMRRLCTSPIRRSCARTARSVRLATLIRSRSRPRSIADRSLCFSASVQRGPGIAVSLIWGVMPMCRNSDCRPTTFNTAVARWFRGDRGWRAHLGAAGGMSIGAVEPTPIGQDALPFPPAPRLRGGAGGGMAANATACEAGPRRACSCNADGVFRRHRMAKTCEIQLDTESIAAGPDRATDRSVLDR